jgi:OmpA-OmpF porin, OOP family
MPASHAPFIHARRNAWFLIAGWLLACVAHAASTPSGDLPGSHDSTVIHRFAGSTIVGYQAADYGEVTLPLGAYRHHQISKSEPARGEIRRIAYIAPTGVSALEVFHNFHQAMLQAGFHTRFRCHGNNGCGSGYAMAKAIYAPVANQLSGGLHQKILRNNTLLASGGDVYVETTRLKKADGVLDSVLLVSHQNGRPTGILIQTARHAPMKTGEVKIDANALDRGLTSSGHMALRGIHFAHDSSSLAKTSDPTLSAMAELLTRKPALKVFIVGHTDNTGTLEHNLSLSRRRAQSVMHALIQRFHIAATRLAAEGVGPYAPVASNATAAGRAMNRRVEMVVR